MTGGFMTSAGRLSLFAAASLLMLGGTSAGAADLGGNCCADLEERIAELESYAVIRILAVIEDGANNFGFTTFYFCRVVFF